jgi:hypothetical protein
MTEKATRPLNHLFILELWQEQDLVSSERDPLRIVLKKPETGEQLSFQSLDQLMAFLVNLLPPMEEL